MSILIFLPLLATVLAVLSRPDQQIFLMSFTGAGLGLGIAVYTFHQCADPAQPQSKGE